jgi:DNA-binding SARP family transcriptional activator/tetratricopeptide (TPR) repeat protein
LQVRFKVLGPVEVSAAGRPLPGLAPRHRAVLAYLLMHAGTVVSAERLIGAVWGQQPPDTARAQVHATMTAIRRVLRRADAAGLLATRVGGYVIQPGPGQFDFEEFTSRIASAQEQADAGNVKQAAGQLRAALALWRGPSLADVDADYVPGARVRLGDRRLAALERLADLELSLGQHEELIGELAPEVAANPLRERLASQLMLALHRAGRQADALSAARAFRAALADQQGLDPGRAFTQLEQAILRDDPRLDHRPPQTLDEPGRRPAGQGRPRQRVNFLPYDTPDFSGRDAELNRLARSEPRGAEAVTLWAIDGMPGIGKTALAVHAAHRLADRFPDGQLFVDLLAHTPGRQPVGADAALEILLRQLGVPAERIPVSLADRAAMWRAELAGRRVLVVLDNAADAGHVRSLLPGASHSCVLITSRRSLTGLEGAQALPLDLLPAADALGLFTRIVGDRADAEPIAVLDVLQLCGFLPLAVRIAAARLQHRPRWTVAYLAGRLRDQRRRLAELAAEDRGVSAAFTMSYQQLDAAQQRLFRLLGLHPGRDIDVLATAALAGITPDNAESLLEDLLDANLVAQQEPGRYTLHDLLREHARATVAATETDSARREALTRVFDYYLHTASAAVDHLYPYSRHLRPQAAGPSSVAVPFDGAAEANRWLEAERANLIAAGTHAGENDWAAAHTSRLAATLHRYLDDHAHHPDALTLHTQALRASQSRDDQAGEVQALLDLGITLWRQGRYDEATEHSKRALDLAHQTGDQLGEARAWYRLGVAHLRQREFEQALDCYQRSLRVNRRLGERLGEANVLGNLGLLYERQGRYEQAHEYQQRALDLYRELGTRGGEATTLGNLGTVYRRQGRYEQARAHHHQALVLFRELGYQRDQAEALNGLGETARATGDPAQAVTHHRAALAIARDIGSPPEQARAHEGLARAHYHLGQTDLAREHATQAVSLYESLGVPEAGEARRFQASLG